LILGNLSYPSRGLSDYASWVWDGCDPVGRMRPEQRFNSGLPAHLIARALGLGGDAYALDAACASSLYALKLACDQLHDGRAEAMVVAGVNAAESLMIHMGFSALQALSPAGMSRPFHRDADGLVPAEGAVAVVLKRLETARRDGDGILGVIRGVGLSNDGRQGGILAPDQGGQVRAMRAAYARSGVDPATIGLLECHATGTTLGDAIEISAMKQVFGDLPELAIGSLKSNLGHLITASGLASLLKLLHAFETGTKPATLHAKPFNAALDGTSFRPVVHQEPWPEPEHHPRRGGINNFGFGGNNAHLIVEAWRPETVWDHEPVQPPLGERVAIVAVQVNASTCDGEDEATPLDTIQLPLRNLGVPPRDLQRSLPQQNVILATAMQAMEAVAPEEKERCGVLVGMGCDAEIVRYTRRWLTPDEDGPGKEAIIPALDAAGTVGAMPNMPANRVNGLQDWRGMGFTVSGEELSGVEALEIGRRAVAQGELDLVLVGAVDLSREPVQQQAAADLLPEDRRVAGDAAVVLVLKRLTDAREQGDRVHAILQPFDESSADVVIALEPGSGPSAITRKHGHAHAASGLLHVAAGIDKMGNHPSVAIDIHSFSGHSRRVTLSSPGEDRPPDPLTGLVETPSLFVYAASDMSGLIHAVENRTPGGEGAVRLAIVAMSEQQVEAHHRDALAFLNGKRESCPSGVLFAESAMGGELAYLFTGAAGAFPGMGAVLRRAFPEVLQPLYERHPALNGLVSTIHDAEADPLWQLKSASLLCQEHATIANDLLGLRPTATLGLSSGESNGLFAFGVWRDMAEMFREIDASRLYGHWLTGSCRSAARAWGWRDEQAVSWRNWRILAPVESVKAVVARHHHVEITIIQSAMDCCIGGEETDCRSVIEEIGTARALPLGQDMVVHCRELDPVADIWHEIHLREAFPAPGIRFYSNTGNRSYEPTRKAAATAILEQARNPVDFRVTVERAWQDGVRIFLEMGPRNALSQAISQTLGERPHLALAMNHPGRNDLEQLARVAAQLHVAGVEVDLHGLEKSLERLRPVTHDQDDHPLLTLPAHLPPMPPPMPMDAQPMLPAPPLPPVAGCAPVAPYEPPESPVTGQEESADSPMARIFSALQSQHTAFIAMQSTSHGHYLDLQKRVWRQMCRINPSSAPAQETASISEVPETLAPSVDEPHGSDGTTATPPIFNRAQLELLASGDISSVLGPLFRQQDGFRRQVRLPEPPLLLVDRVTEITGEAGVLGRGSIVTETDLDNHPWCLHQGRTSLGTLIESGQSDLLLISWQGIDFLNRDERVYRLLGCECTFHEHGLPQAGDTLRYDIHIDGHAESGDVRLFFFHYDCHVGGDLTLSVRHGQAGFFTDAELTDSKGVLWSAKEDEPQADARMAPPPCPTTKSRLTPEELQAWVDGDAFSCFGAGFEM
ncbi:MAG: beta-ketoacyl synthase, partial [Magnetococcales bacterium]|nr:beta-ketoacyl synthase [Magnetococcales bacterium]